jgi:hypothetical protein
MIKVRFLALTLIICLLAACAPSAQSIQTAIAQIQAAWTRVPSQTPYPTQTAYPTLTPRPPILLTQIVVWTPIPNNQDSSCKPITNMNYSDNSKAMILLQAYVSTLPDVKSVSYVIPERLYSNTVSQLVHVRYVSIKDGQVYSKRYIVYLAEFGWKNAVFSIDGQCWIDPPK